ncbi:MAG: hypothetical protein QOD06_3536 [Candidatus Binatota bacterium]|jgi:hypothetical protein|nr:hypothetical protein [Candidatus Binatota bacterium]
MDSTSPEAIPAVDMYAMQRTLTLIATALCAAPLLVLAGFALVQALGRGGGGGSDQSIASAYLGLVAGLAVAALGFVAIWQLGERLVPDRYLRHLQVADGIVLVAGLVLWSWLLAPDPRLEYAGNRGTLEVEARVARSILGGESVDAVVAIDFAGGEDSSVPHPEGAREEGDFVVVPWQTTPITVRAWEVSVFVRDRPAIFTLDLPPRPKRSTEWSGWIAPAARPGYETLEGLVLRYRFRLIPHGSG